ncbi:MAG: hypothetical protein ACYC6M_02525 [Terriglobales bacterium]
MQSVAPSLLAAPAIHFERIQYHGWKNCVRLRNARAEVVIVPTIGRVMQFRRRGGQDTFWENPQRAGPTADPEATEWANFGGDKSWPAPQSAWPLVTGRAWPPPAGFDALPASWRRRGSTIELLSAVDPHYGIRVRRIIRLDPRLARMTIRTTFENVSGPVQQVAIWVVTQLCSPEKIFFSAPEGYHDLETAPATTERNAGWISLERNPDHSVKIGARTSSLLWIKGDIALRIDSPLEPAATYPDGNSSVEVYTSPDPLQYVELETLGPLATLQPGASLSRVNTYTLFRRRAHAGSKDAERLLRQRPMTKRPR